MAIDKETDVIWMGTDAANGSKLFMKDAANNRRDISEFSDEINFESISAMNIQYSALFVAGKGAVAVIDFDTAQEPLFFTNQNSNLSHSGEFSAIIYDSNLDQIVAGNKSTDCDIYDLESEEWSINNQLSKLSAVYGNLQLGLYLYVLTDGTILSNADDEGLEEVPTPMDYPALEYTDIELIGTPEEEEVKVAMLTYESGLVILSEFEALHYTSLNSNIFPTQLNAMTITNDGVIWIAHNGGITSFNDGVFTRLELEPLVGFTTEVNDIVADQNNDLWLGTCNGLIKLSDLETSTKELTQLEINVYPTVSNGLIQIDSDYAGNIQLSTLDGRLILEQDINVGNNSIQITNTKGMCFYSITTTQGIKQGKVYIN